MSENPEALARQSSSNANSADAIGLVGAGEAVATTIVRSNDIARAGAGDDPFAQRQIEEEEEELRLRKRGRASPTGGGGGGPRFKSPNISNISPVQQALSLQKALPGGE